MIHITLGNVMLRCLSLFICFACLAGNAKAHEFWIEPKSFQLSEGEEVIAHLRVGQNFKGASQSFLPPRFTRFEFSIGANSREMPGLIGDRPAVRVKPNQTGLMIIVHETTDSKITWQTFEKFKNFLTHKDAEWVVNEHDLLGFSREKPVEAYSRHAKSLVAVGAGKGVDRPFGLLTELVALDNPFTGDFSDEIRVQLLFQGEPRPKAQVEIFEKDSEGFTRVSTTLTDDKGIAGIRVRNGFSYMLDAVVLRGATEEMLQERGVQWQSHWANLTFAVPK